MKDSVDLLGGSVMNKVTLPAMWKLVIQLEYNAGQLHVGGH